MVLIPLVRECFLLGEKGKQLDRVDKFLLMLPLFPAADLLSTLLSLGSGGQEVGILARPTLEHYGPLGLVMLATSASLIFFASMMIVIYLKKMLISGVSFRWTRYVLTVPIYWFFVLEGFYFSTVVMNLLVPVAPLLTQVVVLRGLIVCAYFACACAVTLPQIRRLPLSPSLKI